VQEPNAAGRIEGGVTNFLLRMMQEKLPLWQAGKEEGGATQALFPQFVRALFQSGSRDVQMLYMAAVLVRRMGRLEEAVSLAQELHARHPAYEPAVAVAYAMREAGRREESDAALQQALQYRPDELTVHLDMGDLRWDEGDWDGAGMHYGLVLQREPQHEWALPCSYAVQFQKTGDPRWREALEQLASAGNDRAGALLFQLGMDLQMYLPEPTDATVNVGEQLFAEFHGKPDQVPQAAVEVTLSNLEPPSAVLAVNYQMRLAGFPQPPRFKVEKIASPDPREPWGKADYVLWRYQGIEALPNYPPAPEAVVEGISRIAAQPYRRDTWRDWGRSLAAALGPVPVEQVLGAMVNPPYPPAEMRAWTWINRFQLAAAFLIAGREHGWAATERRRVLLSLARGPLDWTVEHALIALSAIAEEVPESVPEIAELHLDRLRGAPREGAVCYIPTLCMAALKRPGIEPVEREHWLDILKQVMQD
jgi:tetratricopeptide (TPR) repeat protein